MSWRLTEVRRAWRHLHSAYPRACQSVGSGVGPYPPFLPAGYLFPHPAQGLGPLVWDGGGGCLERQRGKPLGR